MPNTGSRLVNLSVHPTSFVVRLFNKKLTQQGAPLKQGQTTPIHGGDFVQLHHKELGAYVAAEGTFLNKLVTQDVHLRVRQPDPARPNRLLPPTSSVSFWQVEHENSTDGDAVSWMDRVRFKHVITQQYLALTSDVTKMDGVTQAANFTRRRNTMDKRKLFQPREEQQHSISDDSNGNTDIGDDIEEEPGAALTLVDDITDKRTVFILHPIVREGSVVTRGTYCRIEHALTGAWLHGDKTKTVERKNDPEMGYVQGNSGTAESMSAIKWDNATLRPLKALGMCMFDDAFIITTVGFELVQSVAFVANLIPVLTTYCDVRSKSEVDKLITALRELKAFLFHEETAFRQRQKQLRNFRVIELLIEMLRTLFRPYIKPDSAIPLFDKVCPYPVNVLIL
jgi:hypothetical protein